ncbi:MAG: hypothetical protein ACNA7T_10040 [Haliea sp.]
MRNAEQLAYWNGEAGRKWAENDAMMAEMLAPVARDLLNMGPVSRLLQDCDPALREAVHASAIEAMAPWFRDGKIRMPGAVWLVTAGKQ